MKTFDCKLALQKSTRNLHRSHYKKGLFLNEAKLMGLVFGVSGVRDSESFRLVVLRLSSLLMSNSNCKLDQ